MSAGSGTEPGPPSRGGGDGGRPGVQDSTGGAASDCRPCRALAHLFVQRRSKEIKKGCAQSQSQVGPVRASSLDRGPVPPLASLLVRLDKSAANL